jgi:hypothetical protein
MRSAVLTLAISKVVVYMNPQPHNQPMIPGHERFSDTAATLIHGDGEPLVP